MISVQCALRFVNVHKGNLEIYVFVKWVAVETCLLTSNPWPLGEF